MPMKTWSQNPKVWVLHAPLLRSGRLQSGKGRNSNGLRRLVAISMIQGWLCHLSKATPAKPWSQNPRGTGRNNNGLRLFQVGEKRNLCPARGLFVFSPHTDTIARRDFALPCLADWIPNAWPVLGLRNPLLLEPPRALR